MKENSASLRKFSPLVLEDKQRIKTQGKSAEINGGRGLRSRPFELPYPQLLYF